MKKLLYISLGFNLIVILGAVYLSFIWRKLAEPILVKNVLQVHYDRKLSMFRACPEVKGAIIFVGNSITEGGHWDELFEGLPVLNRGIGGDITSGVLSRLDEIIRHQPSRVFFCIGTNDLARGVEMPDIMANYRQILETTREASPDTRIYVQSVLPVGRKVLFGHSNDKIRPLNEAIRELCIELDITYIDLYPELLDADGYLDSRYSNDNLHLLGEAYLLWKEKINDYVME